jgi:hypothetical protein
MFFEGYIGAPPTVTIFSSFMLLLVIASFFICANVGDATSVPSASAAAATVVRVVMRESFITSSMNSRSSPLLGLRSELREDAARGRVR